LEFKITVPIAYRYIIRTYCIFYVLPNYFYDSIRTHHWQQLLHLNPPHEAYLCMQNDNELFCVNKSPACEISGICFVVSCYCCLLLTFGKGVECIWQRPSVNTENFLPPFPPSLPDNPILEINIIFERSYNKYDWLSSTCVRNSWIQSEWRKTN